MPLNHSKASGSSGDGAMYLVKFQAGVTPPVVLFFLGFSGEELRTDGTWDELHERWLQPIGVPDADPPSAQYRD